jgi:cyclin B
MIASKDLRIQDIGRKTRHTKKDSKDIFLENNINNLNCKEVLLKQQRDNISTCKNSVNIRITNENNLNKQNEDFNKMQIDSEIKNNLLKNNNNKNKNINFKNNQNETTDSISNKTVIIQQVNNEIQEKVLDEKKSNNKFQFENHLEKKKSRKDILNEILISNYGPEIYEFSMELENISYCPNNLKKHKIEPEIRTKMIDWMVEVLSAYNSDPQTFSLSVQILDMFLAKTKNVLTNNDVHLIGICSMYIASKMEDIVPLRMNHVKSKISHNKFTEKEIKKKEKAILETINFEVINTSTYDFIRTFIFDFIHNNRSQIHRLEMFHHIDVFDNVAIFLSKLIYHCDEFNLYK